MSAMQPNPRPRAILPASHPATRPRRSHATIPCVSNQTPMVLCVGIWAANMKPPKGTQIVSDCGVLAIEYEGQGEALSARPFDSSAAADSLADEAGAGRTRILIRFPVAAGSCNGACRVRGRDRGTQCPPLHGPETNPQAYLTPHDRLGR